MRLLHPKTINIISKQMNDSEFKNATSSRKQVISHAWSEVLKYLATRNKSSHPKMFIDNDYDLGTYSQIVYNNGLQIGCNLNDIHLEKYDDVFGGFIDGVVFLECIEPTPLKQYFDDNYLFSDAVSLYYKGINIFPYVFGDDWRKYCPVISVKEIHRQIDKTINKEG